MSRIAQIEKLIEQLTASQIKTDAQLAKTDSKLKVTRDMLHGIGVNLGSVTEAFFFNALKDRMQLGNIKFDSIAANVTSTRNKITDEFDIVLYNGSSIAIIETKHKVHPGDVDKLINKKLVSFRRLFPQYKNHTIYLGMGGLSFPKDVAENALSNGVIVIKQKGDVAIINDMQLKAF